MDSVRLDVWLDVACVFKTRSEAQKACKLGKVSVNGQLAKAHRDLKAGDRLIIQRPMGRKQLLTVLGVADRSVSRAEARLMYDDTSPKPTPEEVLAQVQAQSIQADIQKKAAELELQREKMLRDDDYRRDQLAQDLLLKKYELELKYGTQISTAEIDARQAMDREAMRQQTALVQNAVQAAGQVQAPPVEQLPSINLNGMVQ